LLNRLIHSLPGVLSFFGSSEPVMVGSGVELAVTFPADTGVECVVSFFTAGCTFIPGSGVKNSDLPCCKPSDLLP
jgi:hypothetical protein